MKTLELKDIAAYLPYGLNYIYEGKTIGEVRMKDYDTTIDSMLCLNCIIKPILRPMSDLTKEITHRGEKFVPILILADIACPGNGWSLQGKSAWSGGYFEGFTFYYDEGNFVIEETDYEDCQYRSRPATLNNSIHIFDKLSEWMIDYRGLIPAGLAVDVNTLEKNPYEV